MTKNTASYHSGGLLNAVEQFRSENKSPSQALCTNSVDRIKQVREHNRDYPRLDEILDNKKSVIKVTTLRPRHLSKYFDRTCNACVKMATYKCLKRIAPKPKCSKRECSRYVHRRRHLKNYCSCTCHRTCSEYLLGIHKKKARYHCINNHYCKRYLIDRSCQYSRTSHRDNKCTSYRLRNETAIENPSKKSENQDQKGTKKDPSVSTFNSYGSLSQEPMDV